MARKRKLIPEDDALKETRQSLKLQKRMQQQKKTKLRLSQRLAQNIKLYSEYIMQRGNVTMASISSEFCYELVDLMMETITEMLIDGQPVYLDQFGKFEVVVRPSSTVCTVFTNYKPMEVPEIKLVKFRPAKRLKDRLRGVASGRLKKEFGKSRNYY